MQDNNFIEHLATPLQHKASVKNVFGDPVVMEGKTIIPVAQIAFGFGGGFGSGNRPAGAENTRAQNGEGAGGGGGMIARAKGVYEITAHNTRYIPVSSWKPLLVAALAGFLVRGWLRH